MIGAAYKITDYPAQELSVPPRLLPRLKRRRGLLVRYWDADFNLLGTDPVRREPLLAWARRVARLLFAR